MNCIGTLQDTNFRWRLWVLDDRLHSHDVCFQVSAHANWSSSMWRLCPKYTEDNSKLDGISKIWLTGGCKIQQCIFVCNNLYWFNFNTGYFHSTTILIQLQHWIFSFKDYIHSTSAGLFLWKTNIYSTSTPKVMFYETNTFLQLQQKNSLIQQNTFTQLFKFPDIDFSHLFFPLVLNEDGWSRYRPLALRGHVTNASLKQWVVILLLPNLKELIKIILLPKFERKRI